MIGVGRWRLEDGVGKGEVVIVIVIVIAGEMGVLWGLWKVNDAEKILVVMVICSEERWRVWCGR